MWLIACGCIQAKARRVFQRLLMEAARFERCGDASRNAGPARDAIERVPAVIAEDAAAGKRRIDAPVCDPVRAHRNRRLRSERPPADPSHGADCALVNQGRDLAADRRMKPIVHRVQDPPGARRGGRHALCVLDPGDHRFFAEHMKARVEAPVRSAPHGCPAARRCRRNRAFRPTADRRQFRTIGRRDRRRERLPGAKRRRRSRRRSARRHERSSRASAPWPRRCRSR